MDVHAAPLNTRAPSEPHPLLPRLLAAANGSFPSVDGTIEVLPALARGMQAVVSFTGHTIMATALEPAKLNRLQLDGYGSALHPGVLLEMAGPYGQIGVIDVTLSARGSGGGDLARRGDLNGHARVRHAHGWRTNVRVHGDHRGFVTLGHGLAGRTEMSVELNPRLQGHGVGPSLIQDALGLVGRGKYVFAAVSPGNARSLRAFIRAGFQPLCSEVIIKGQG